MFLLFYHHLKNAEYKQDTTISGGEKRRGDEFPGERKIRDNNSSGEYGIHGLVKSRIRGLLKRV